MSEISLPEYLSLQGVIRNETFQTFHTHPKRCSFKLEHVIIQYPLLSETDQMELAANLTETTFVYWAEMKHFLPILCYTVDLTNIKQSTFRGNIQYNVEKEHLKLTKKEVMEHIVTTTKANESPIQYYHSNVDSAIISLFGIQDGHLLEEMKRKITPDLPNLAHIITFFDINAFTKTLSKDQQALLSTFGANGAHLSNHALLHGKGIKSSDEEESIEKTKELVVLLYSNPYEVLSVENYDSFRNYKGLTFERMEQLAMELYGPQVVKDEQIIQHRYAAALISVFIEYEVHTGSTILLMSTAIRLVAKKINQAESIVNETLRKYPQVYQHLLLTDEPEIKLQRPETRRKETQILEWTQDSSILPGYIIDEELLAHTLDFVYGSATRDEKQIEAIRLAISRPVTLISGPPGSGKTTYVVRTIVRYLEKRFESARACFEEQYEERNKNDLSNTMQELTNFIRNMFNKYCIVGDLDGETMESNEFNEYFINLMDQLNRKRKGYDTSKKMIPVMQLKRICHLKLHELKKNAYRLYASSDLSGVKMMAPSGVASRRLKDACDGHQTHTCCSLLAQMEEDAKKKARQRDIFPFQMLLIDEASMIDMDTLIQIIKMAAVNRSQILLIGDHHQLPPIGLGQVFRDLIRGDISKVVLTNIYRQGKGSKIAQLSKSIIAGSLSLNEYKHHALNDETDITRLIGEIGSIEEEIVKVDYDIEFTKLDEFVSSLYTNLVFHQNYKVGQVQILTPYKDKCGGRSTINQLIQEKVAARRKELNEGRDINQPHPKFYAMDPVIHRKNNKALDIFNGDQGRVMAVFDPEQYRLQNVVPVQYPHQIVNYCRSKNAANPPLYELELAYCLTAHLSQVMFL